MNNDSSRLKNLFTTLDNSFPRDDWSGAINMLFIEDKLVFIKRSYTMPSHKGQIGFFGGHREQSEDSPITTGLRELEEESGISSDQVKVHGCLKPVSTNAGRLIIPVVSSFQGTEADFLQKVKPNREWSNLIIVPVEYLYDSRNWSSAKIISSPVYYVYFCSLSNKANTFYKKPGQSNLLLWGASAKMVWNLFEKSILSVKN